MFKLVVLCAFFAAAAAEPSALIAAPITQYSTFLTPGATTIARQDSTVIHPSPLFYQAPLAYTHFIKKRSAQFPLTYSVPPTYYPNYYAASTYNAPLIHSAPILPAPFGSVPAVHLIKKRSAQFPLTYSVPPTYYPNYYAASTYNAPLIHSAPILPAPFGSVPAVHLIKKRSAVLPATTFYASSTYGAPASLLASTYASPILSHAPLISQPLISQPLISQRLISQPLISQPLISQPLFSHLIKK